MSLKRWIGSRTSLPNKLTIASSALAPDPAFSSLYRCGQTSAIVLATIGSGSGRELWCLLGPMHGYTVSDRLCLGSNLKGRILGSNMQEWLPGELLPCEAATRPEPLAAHVHTVPKDIFDPIYKALVLCSLITLIGVSTAITDRPIVVTGTVPDLFQAFGCSGV